MAKRYFTHLIPSDRIRELEMAVDACVVDQGYAMQFFTDLQIYGLREAVTYLTNTTPPSKAEELSKVCELRDAIIAQIENPPQMAGNGPNGQFTGSESGGVDDLDR